MTGEWFRFGVAVGLMFGAGLGWLVAVHVGQVRRDRARRCVPVRSVGWSKPRTVRVVPPVFDQDRGPMTPTCPTKWVKRDDGRFAGRVPQDGGNGHYGAAIRYGHGLTPRILLNWYEKAWLDEPWLQGERDWRALRGRRPGTGGVINWLDPLIADQIAWLANLREGGKKLDGEDARGGYRLRLAGADLGLRVAGRGGDTGWELLDPQALIDGWLGWMPALLVAAVRPWGDL